MAGRIPQNFIDDLLERIDIVEVIDRRVALKKAGRNFKACCPFHDEKTPSFNVNPDKQFYHCFGCGAGGNAVGFVMDYDNVDFPAAIESLAALAGVEVPREQSSQQQQKRYQQSQNLYASLAFASHFYLTQLRQHADKNLPVSYLKKRGLSGEIARDFAIGFAPAGWNNLLDAATQAGDEQQLQLLESAGMLVKKDNGGYYDRFRERVMFPIRDNRGRVIAFGGRVLGDDNPKYLNSPESDIFHKQRELYGLYEARKKNTQLDYLLLVEGYLDVISLFQFGLCNAVATLGTASSFYHLEKIFRYTSKLVVCFDGDAAGAKAAQRLLEIALPAMRDGREICFLFLPAGEDPDTFVRSQGKQAFLHAIDNALPLEQALFDTAGKGISLDSEAGKARFAQAALPLIKQLPNGIFRQRMISKLGELAGVSPELLSQQLGQVKTRTNEPPDNSHPAPAPASAEQPSPAARHNSPARSDASLGATRTPVIWALSTLLHHPEFAMQIALPDAISENESGESRLLTDIYQYIKNHVASEGVAPTTYKLLGHWHGTEQGQALNRCAARHTPPEDKTIAEAEFGDTLAKIAAAAKEQQSDALIQQITQRPPSELSDEEKQFLQALGKKSKKPE